MIKAKIISIGDEILIGQINNTNSTYMCGKLYSIGIKVDKIITIGDEREVLLSELNDSLKNFDVTLITGGLGPTHDDITKSILTEFADDILIRRDDILEHIKGIFSRRNILMPISNEEQALVPSKASVIWNKNGTAPGLWFEIGGKVFVAMPGVPYEMKAMMEDYILEQLRAKFTGNTGYFSMSETVLTTGISESALFEMLGKIDVITGMSKMAFLPSPMGVRVRIDVKEADESLAKSELERIKQILSKKAGEYIYGLNDDSLEVITGNLLKKHGLTVSTAESCTGGLLSGRITDISGSSEYFNGGICSYSNAIKEGILGVSSDTLSMYGAVSSETAEEMAVNIRKKFKSDIGISTTGIAGPTGATTGKPVGLTYIGFSAKNKSYSKQYFMGDNRERNRMKTVQAALDLLRRELLLL
ncbi:MAG: competence/damage-inducible protein A [Ignavibacteria bacterium]|nr:competence/damage-inducible protein A [Ignavibacteria bacterium]